MSHPIKTKFMWALLKYLAASIADMRCKSALKKKKKILENVLLVKSLPPTKSRTRGFQTPVPGQDSIIYLFTPKHVESDLFICHHFTASKPKTVSSCFSLIHPAIESVLLFDHKSEICTNAFNVSKSSGHFWTLAILFFFSVSAHKGFMSNTAL